MPGNGHLIHMGTITMGMREFVVMVHVQNSKAYIEEVVLTTLSFEEDVTANCKFIDDDNLVHDLAAFAEEHKLLDIKRIMNTLIDSGKIYE